MISRDLRASQLRTLALTAAAAMAFWPVARIGLAQAPAAGGASAPSAVDPQGYKILVPIPSLATNKVTESKVKGTIRSYLLSPDNDVESNQVFFDSYYVRFFFPMLTQTTPEALRDLPERRNAFFRTEVEICRNAEEHAHLVGLTLDQMSAIVQDTFHPVVRYNAMLIIATLNDQEIVRTGGSPKIAEPMARALPFMLAEFQKPDNNDAIKVAALIGISRHLEWDPHRTTPMPAALRTQIINEMLSVAQAKDPPAGRNAEGHLWFRRRAVEALGFASYSKLEPPVADALEKLLKDESEPLTLRFTVAAAVGRLNYQAPIKLDAVATAKELGYLALLACDSELNRIQNLKETEEERVARLSGQVGRGGFGGEGGNPMGAAVAPPMPAGGEMGGGFGQGAANLLGADPKAYRFDLVRRRIRQQLYCVQFGLTGGDDFDPARTSAVPGAGNASRGMKAFAKAGPETQYVVDVYAKVRKLAEIVESKAVDMPQLEKDLRKTMKPLEAVTKKLAPPPVPGAPPAEAAIEAPAAPPGAKPAASEPAKPAAAPAPPAEAPAAEAPAEAAPPATPAKAAPVPAPPIPAAP